MGRVSKEQTQLNKEKLLVALEKKLGNITAACKSVGLSRMTYNNYKNNDPEFAEAARQVSEVAIDFVESKLMENIQKNKETSIIFFLKTRAKHRGYVEKTETDITSNGERIGIPISNWADENENG